MNLLIIIIIEQVGNIILITLFQWNFPRLFFPNLPFSNYYYNKLYINFRKNNLLKQCTF